jgi:PAS domain S-box-containing protein
MFQPIAQSSESLIQSLKPHSKSVSVALSCFLVLLFGFLDYLSGPTVSLSILYVIPIVLATWNVGQTNGIALAAASAAVCLADDLMGSAAYLPPGVPYLNAIMRFCLFLMVVLLVSQVRTTNKRLHLTVVEKTTNLIAEFASRSKAEEELTKLSGAVRQTADSVVITSRDGIIEYVNPAFEKLTGYSKEEVIGRTPGILKSGKHDQEFYEALWETILSGRIFRAEFANRKKSGELYYQEETITPIVNGNRSATHFVSTGRDITERKRVEEKLRKSYEQLHQFAVHLQSAREEERSQIAREIHDELGQALTGLKFDISWIGKKLPEGTEELQEKTRSIGKFIDGTIQMVRRISTELRPGVLDRLGLAAAIEWQVQEFQDRTGIRCMLTPNFDGLKLDRDKAMAIFRIFQEALTNVARHANATAVDVNSSLESGNLMLEVRDNGRGIAENELLDPKSLGLLGMKERALAFGGRVNVVGNPGKGTKVILVIPCSPAENEADTS